MSLYTELDHRTYHTILLLFFFFLSSLLNWKVLRAGDIVGVQCMFTALNCDLQDSGLGPDARTTQEQEVMPPCCLHEDRPLPHLPSPTSRSLIHHKAPMLIQQLAYTTVFIPDNCPETLGLFVTNLNSRALPRPTASGSPGAELRNLNLTSSLGDS